MRSAALTALVVCAALLAAGCGGGGSGGSSSTAPGAGGTPKKATAPNAPAGSKVVGCQEGDAHMRGLRATAIDCGTARETMARWGRTRACNLPADASRGSCALAGFRCQVVKTDRGLAVSCARPGGDVAFVATRAGTSR